MKLALALTSIFFGPALFAFQEQQTELGLPVLQTIKTATLSPAYGCRSQNELQAGYQNTALFLSKYSAISGKRIPGAEAARTIGRF